MKLYDWEKILGDFLELLLEPGTGEPGRNVSEDWEVIHHIPSRDYCLRGFKVDSLGEVDERLVLLNVLKTISSTHDRSSEEAMEYDYVQMSGNGMALEMSVQPTGVKCRKLDQDLT